MNAWLKVGGSKFFEWLAPGPAVQRQLPHPQSCTCVHAPFVSSLAACTWLLEYCFLKAVKNFGDTGKDAEHHWSLRKYKSKPQWETTR